MKSYANGNQKGGVGKTTITVFAAAAAVELGARVLVGDLDPQGNATSTLDAQVSNYTVNDLLYPNPSGDVVEGAATAAICSAGPDWPTIDVLPATLGLADREGDQVLGREYRLRTACHGCLDDYDLVLWDLPPSLGQLAVNGLTLTDEVRVIVEPKRYALDGAAQMMTTIQRVQRYYNPGLAFSGLHVNRNRERTIEGRERLTELYELYPGAVLDPLLPYMEVLTKASGACAPLSAYGAESHAARDLFRSIAAGMLDGARA